MGRNAGSRNVRSPANTRAMKTPSGLVTAKISARNTKICSQPLMVISKFLRTQKRVEQINRGRRADDEHDERLDIHRAFLFHAVAEMHVCDREGKECDRDCGPKNVLHTLLPNCLGAKGADADSSGLNFSESELDHDGHVDEVLVAPQVGEPHTAALCCARGLSRAQSQLHRRISV